MKVVFAVLASLVGFSASAQNPRQPISEVLKNETATYQILFKTEYRTKDDQRVDVVLQCEEGLLRDAVVQDSRPQFAYQGVILRDYKKYFLRATISLATTDDGKIELTSYSHFWLPNAKSKIGHPIGVSKIDLDNLKPMFTTYAHVYENGMAIEEPFDPYGSYIPDDSISFTLNPKRSCADRVKESHPPVKK